MALVVGTNSYGSQSEADAYFEDSVHNNTWSSYTSEQKDQGLVTATRQLERQSWDGTKEDSTQILDFPRTGLYDCAGNSITADESLTYIKEAEFEYSLAILQDNSILTSSNVSGSNIKKAEAGSAKVTYFRPVTGTKYPLPVLNIVKCFFLGNSSSTPTMRVSGNSDGSSFTSAPAYGLNRGFK